MTAGSALIAAKGVRSSSRQRRSVRRMVLSSIALISRSPARFDRIPDFTSKIAAGESTDLLNAGRRSHVDLGEPVADYIDARENEAALLQCRSDGFADLAIARGQFGGFRFSADMEIS